MERRRDVKCARCKTTNERETRERERKREKARERHDARVVVVVVVAKKKNKKTKKTWSAARRRTRFREVMVKVSGAMEAVVGETRGTPTTRGTPATAGKPWRCSEGTCGRPARYSHSSSRGCLKPRRRGARVRRTKQSAKVDGGDEEFWRDEGRAAPFRTKRRRVDFLLYRYIC